MLFRVVVPHLRPVILFAIITSTIGGLQIFTVTIVLYLWQKSFNDLQFGYGAAMGWILFALSAVFAVISWRLVSGGDRDNRRGIPLLHKGGRNGR
ncbi:ABC-type sugar transport system permease subunit [Streptomyces canus]|uniref:ABC-type sugar transport system permease subunit n=1 Tax=Streptomyces canus TaxID=58343 RepID=A0AAW8FRG9_9ACTN|nr:ABC-type sugar transport system permease subunit [Streptomyces canus]MDQ0911606.1 ABC-type sugar transport system permease subunit [Streptomyces canus]